MIDNQMFHITKNGAEKCTAKKRACPLGGAHFFEKEEAEKYFHDTMIAEIGKFGDAALKKATVKANEPHMSQVMSVFLGKS